MKRKYIFYLMIALIPMLCGCGNKTLVCSNVNDDFGMNVETIITAKYNKDKATSVKIDVKKNVLKSFVKYIDRLEKSLYDDYKAYEESGAKVSTKVNDNVINVHIEFNMKKLTEEQKNNLDISYVFNSKNIALEELEKNGYTCK